MSRVPPSKLPPKPAPVPVKPRTNRTSHMTAAQKAAEAKADEMVPEVKEGVHGPHEHQEHGAQHGSEHAAIAAEEHQAREERLEHHEEHAEEERKAEQEGKVLSTTRTVPQKQGNQKSGAEQNKAANLFEQHAKQARKDGFEGPQGLQTTSLAQLQALQAKKLAQTQKITAPTLNVPQPRGNLGDAMKALHNAQEPGVFFKEHQAGGRPDEEMEDPELAAAVEECIRMLFGVRGVLRVGPGENDAGEPVVLISAARGFTQQSMAQVPPKVHRFKTLLALPFELLPLKRERP